MAPRRPAIARCAFGCLDCSQQVHAHGRVPRGCSVGEQETAGLFTRMPTAERGPCRVQKAVERLGVRHVTHRRVDRNGPAAQLSFSFAQCRLTAGADGDAGTLVGQPVCDRAANAAVPR